MIFKDHRIYAPGDDFRAIDWRVFARTDDLMVKNYEEERNLVVHVLVDSSLSMNFGRISKFDYASMIGVGYAYLAMKNNDKFQFATFSEDIEFFQPKKGMSQLMAMIDYLNGMKLKGKTSILKMAQVYRKLLGSRALVILISDFLAPLDDIKNALHYFTGNDVHVVQVLDPLEKEPSMDGDLKLKDSETTDLMRTYFSLKSKEDYIKRLDSHASEIEQECSTLGMTFFQAITNKPIFDTFYALLR
jgi:uncharacterized protein (DUF58 family)